MALKPLSYGYFLLKNRNPHQHQYTTSRRAKVIPQGVVHTYEAPPERSLLAAATYIGVTRTTPGSYHWLAGDDNATDVMPMAPVTAETWHSIPSNPWAIGFSAVTYADTWDDLPEWQRVNLVKSLAYAAYLASMELIALGLSPIPARRITRAEAMRGVWGFVGHGEMDPDRRHDPGEGFPWSLFLNHYQSLLDGNEEDTMAAADVERIIENQNRVKTALDEVKASLEGLPRAIVKAERTNHAAGRMEKVLRDVAERVGAPVADSQEVARQVVDLIADDLGEAVAVALATALPEGVTQATVDRAVEAARADLVARLGETG